MPEFTDALTTKHKKFIAEQMMFFVATAPKDGRLNLSPKGLVGTFAVINDNCVAYLDFVGSGNETAAHILDDGRMVIMMNSYTKVPLILRLYGTARFAHNGTDEFNDNIHHFNDTLAKRVSVRQIIFLDINSVQTSCGWGVPMMEMAGERETMKNWADKKGPEGVEEYKNTRNVTSIDGLPTGINPTNG
jgi:hypothetical protein